jgi:hypothetical protein
MRASGSLEEAESLMVLLMNAEDDEVLFGEFAELLD